MGDGAAAAEPARRERGRRHAGGEAASRKLPQLPWDQPQRLFPPMAIASTEQIETIHRAALDVLEDIGMEILLPEARDILEKAGAKVDGAMVWIGREIVEAAIGTAPEDFTFHARNQAAYESVFSLWGAIMGGGNLIVHAAGWMEGGLVASFEKYALDIDLLQMVATFLKPFDTSPDALGIDAMREVGPGGHFFGAAHTLARYSTAFYAPLISDWRNFQQREAAGSPHAWQKANQAWKRALAEYEEPYLDPAIAEELDAFVARRIAEGGQPTDF
ncbi:MAG: hypothetical protein EXQ94_07855 [Alphaproteobacteria bacterium]|nr:hypothetical protein [Alphaproteobacteria bacterium]